MNEMFSTIVLIAVFAAGFLVATAFITAPAGTEGMAITGAMVQQLPCMSTNGYTEAGVSVDAENIYLEAGCRRLVMATNEIQTYSINSGMKGTRDVRPTTHDIIKDIIETFGLEPLIVKIESADQGTYFAKLALRQGDKVLDMDIRPSDAIAVAVRTGTPIYVNEALLLQQGEFIC